MSTNLISLERVGALVSETGANGPNLFLGAGLSRDAPTNGPIWTEMQVGFLQAVFDRMEAESWPAASDFPAHREKAQELGVRPELFWREMLDVVGESVIWNALRAAGAGAPNENHARVAALLQSRRCQWAITTNFDEHVEALLADGVEVALPTSQDRVSDTGRPTYVKLHGSIGAGPTLSYTLEHYDDLERRHASLLAGIVPGRPLIVAGYSGYDTDVMPALRDLSNRVPWLVIVQHPGSPDEQPILQLASEAPHCHILRATCPQVLGVLAEGLAYPPAVGSEAGSRDAASYYTEAVERVKIHLCPAVIGTAFRLNGTWWLVRTYAWLTHDAVTDTRYQSSIPSLEYQRIHQELALALKLAGDSGGAQIMLNEAKASLDESAPRFSAFLRQMAAEAVTKDAPSQHRGVDTPTRTTFPRFKPSEIIAGQLAFSEKREAGIDKSVFLARWQLGVARRREGNPGGAIQAFEGLMPFVLGDDVTHLERGHFLLDYGGAIYEHAAALRDDELAEQAHLVFLSCAKCTKDSGDWPTNARAHRMLAVLFTNGGNFAEAWEHLELARHTVRKTGDTALSRRIEEHARILEELQKQHGE